jgi:hypothetical protein
MPEYVFHVLHNAKPEYELDVLELLIDGNELSYSDVLAQGAAAGFSIGHHVSSERMLRDIFQPLRDLALMEKRQIRLTSDGQALAKIARKNPDLATEVFHYLYYSMWDPAKEAENCFSWSYRTICNHLWSQGTAIIDVTSLASLVPAEASREFSIIDVSFSARSVNGVFNWLEGLAPSIISSDDGHKVFSRRAFCPPETFLLAANFAYRVLDLDFGTNLLLSDDKRQLICQVCMLEPAAFDRVADYAVAQFDSLEKGLGGGWGSYLNVQRCPQLTDFL